VKLNTKELNKPITLKGYIRRISQTKSFLKRGTFECKSCGYGIGIDFSFTSVDEKHRCVSCNKQLFMLEDESKFIDVEYAVLQGESTKAVSMIDLVISDNSVSVATSGDYVVIDGILRQLKAKKTNLYNFFIEVLSIELLDKRMEAVSFSEEDIVEIESVAKLDNRIEVLIKPFASHLYGLDFLKEALLYVMLSSPQTQVDGGGVIRGDIHAISIGPPSTGKSDLLMFISKNLIHRCVYSSGKGNSAAGMTATAVRDPDGRWNIEAGILPFADLSIAIIDEFNQMSGSDKSSLHEAMEQQSVSVAKAGVYANLSTRCGIIAGANPKYGRFDEFKDLIAQFDIEAPLLSRFDCIFVVKELIENSSEATSHILDVAQGKSKTNVDSEFLRKYIAYCRKTCNPELSDKPRSIIEDYYKSLVEIGRANNSINITFRQLWSLVRLSKASARSRLSDEVSVDDALKAIEVYKFSLSSMGIKDDQASIDKFMIGEAPKKQKDYDNFVDIVKALQERDDVANKADIISSCEEAKIDRKKTLEFIDKSMASGKIYEPKDEKYRWVE